MADKSINCRWQKENLCWALLQCWSSLQLLSGSEDWAELLSVILYFKFLLNCAGLNQYLQFLNTRYFLGKLACLHLSVKFHTATHLTTPFSVAFECLLHFQVRTPSALLIKQDFKEICKLHCDKTHLQGAKYANVCLFWKRSMQIKRSAPTYTTTEQINRHSFLLIMQGRVLAIYPCRTRLHWFSSWQGKKKRPLFGRTNHGLPTPVPAHTYSWFGFQFALSRSRWNRAEMTQNMFANLLFV